MKSKKSYIALALIASLAMQPITAQPVEQTAQQKNKVVKQLKDSFKSLTKRLQCTGKRDCTPEQRKRIRRAAIAIVALVGTALALYVGKRILQRPRGMRAKPRKLPPKGDAPRKVGLPGRSREEQQEELTKGQKELDGLILDEFLRGNSTISDDQLIKKTLARFSTLARSAPGDALVEIKEALKRARLIQKYEQKLNELPTSHSNKKVINNIQAAKDAAASGRYAVALILIGVAEDILRKQK